MRALGFAWVLAFVLALVGIGCSDSSSPPGESEHHEEGAERSGPHGGRVFVSGTFGLELALIEAGGGAFFRAWPTSRDEPVDGSDVELRVKLSRLGGRVDEHAFGARDGVLESEGVVAEPHSFDVLVEAVHAGRTHRFEFEQAEGRTRIDSDVAESLGLVTEVAGPASISESIRVFGRVRAHPDHVRRIRARFDGVIDRVTADLGARVGAGDVLLRIESNESLQVYAVRAPIGGVVTARNASAGEQTAGRVLLELTDTSRVLIELSVFPSDRGRVGAGDRITVLGESGAPIAEGVIASVDAVARADQSVVARAELENEAGVLVPGSFVTVDVSTARHDVPLAVRAGALQRYRDWSVVFEQVGDEYEVRPLELGRRDAAWVEVLGGLSAGAVYVVENSHLVKADVEKSGAAHDH